MNEHQIGMLRLLAVAIGVDQGVDAQTRIMAKAFVKSLDGDPGPVTIEGGE